MVSIFVILSFFVRDNAIAVWNDVTKLTSVLKYPAKVGPLPKQKEPKPPKFHAPSKPCTSRAGNDWLMERGMAWGPNISLKDAKELMGNLQGTSTY